LIRSQKVIGSNPIFSTSKTVMLPFICNKGECLTGFTGFIR
jgi:hypothetical protein